MVLASWLALLTPLFSQSVHKSVPQAALAVPSMLSLPPLDNTTRVLQPHEIAAYKPYSWYASTVACNIDDIKNWTCGPKCTANCGFQHIITREYGPDTQFWFSGYDPKLNEVIVSHQGSAGTAVVVGTDLNFFLVPLDSSLFPNVDQSILVHNGTATSHSRSAHHVLDAVKETLSLYPTKKVTVVGPSLGAAIALLDAVFLPLHLPKDVTVRYIGYSSFRVGNQAFVDYVDAQGMSITRINNKQDPVPDLPPREFFDYHHTSGEIHINNNNSWVACSGQDNTDAQCTTGSVTLSTMDPSQHNGPFDGVSMGGCEKDLGAGL